MHGAKVRGPSRRPLSDPVVLGAADRFASSESMTHRRSATASTVPRVFASRPPPCPRRVGSTVARRTAGDRLALDPVAVAS